MVCYQIWRGAGGKEEKKIKFTEQTPTDSIPFDQRNLIENKWSQKKPSDR